MPFPTVLFKADKLSRTISISFSLVSRPRLKRIDVETSVSLTPIAFSTGDIKVAPEWHADPVETATQPSPFIMFSNLNPKKLIKRVLGKRFSG